jgi:hypothetical protein
VARAKAEASGPHLLVLTSRFDKDTLSDLERQVNMRLRVYLSETPWIGRPAGVS